MAGGCHVVDGIKFKVLARKSVGPVAVAELVLAKWQRAPLVLS